MTTVERQLDLTEYGLNSVGLASRATISIVAVGGSGISGEAKDVYVLRASPFSNQFVDPGAGYFYYFNIAPVVEGAPIEAVTQITFLGQGDTVIENFETVTNQAATKIYAIPSFDTNNITNTKSLLIQTRSTLEDLGHILTTKSRVGRITLFAPVRNNLSVQPIGDVLSDSYSVRLDGQLPVLGPMRMLIVREDQTTVATGVITQFPNDGYYQASFRTPLDPDQTYYVAFLYQVVVTKEGISASALTNVRCSLNEDGSRYLLYKPPPIIIQLSIGGDTIYAEVNPLDNTEVGLAVV